MCFSLQEACKDCQYNLASTFLHRIYGAFQIKSVLQEIVCPIWHYKDVASLGRYYERIFSLI